ncbi:GAF domain-containing DNA-binding protein [Hymenobacter lapidiphilus]|uniref:GAF domain-containing DNA-binding protein n=1 Tax=Hymenobacter lapidiphilus TaxID=2608003 RepID=A0A7Y7U4A8_9BACT|nr:GAF domain-containing DNA-binding protein [Hymenobacter lapidiphilus]NVO30208.1 GAF domain-containing DNA-binding protein [Hymenobacter lapidiphilus]
MLLEEATSYPRVQAGLSRAQEIRRLTALQSYEILDTTQEAAFDDLARLASVICNTPVSLVSLLDGERQWFKARTDCHWPASTPRELAFCQHAIQGRTLYEVEDAACHPLFEHNQMVTGEPNIRFYAGYPLLTPQGDALGTLCVIDTVPRRLTDGQRDALAVLSREVVAHLELRRARLELEQERRKLDDLLRLANDTAESLYLSKSQNEIFIKQDSKLLRLKTADIRYVEALGDYVNIYAGPERYTIYSTMKELESRLPTRDFARVHRKYIVRLDRIIAIESDALLVEADRGAEGGPSLLPVPIGNSFKAGLLSRLNLV